MGVTAFMGYVLPFGQMSFWGATLITNNKIPFFPFIFIKDFFGFILILCLYLIETHFGISSFFTFFFFGEIINLTAFHRLNNNGFSNFSLSFFFLSFLSFLWIGAQFPQDNFLSYARILTLDYYFLLICILFRKK